MMINFEEFTPFASLIGGLIIGLSAGAMKLFNGRIAGISGIVGNLFKKIEGQRLAFILGLFTAPWVAYIAGLEFQVRHVVTSPWLALAGFLVGIGTRMGSGCTSGHGICGLSRFSPRSLVAVITFLVFGSVMSFITTSLIN